MSNEKLREALERIDAGLRLAEVLTCDVPCTKQALDTLNHAKDAAASLRQALASIPVAAADQPATEPHPVARLNLFGDGAEDVARGKLLAMRRMADACRHPSYVEIIDEVLAALAALSAVPDGMVLVPREPTGGMVEAGFDSLAAVSENFWGASWSDVAANIYRAMLLTSKDTRP